MGTTSKRRRRAGPGRPGRATGDDARQRLLDAAADRFARDGFAGTSLRSVAGQAGVTPAMVAYYFGDKWGLLETVLAEGFDGVLAALENAVEASYRDGSSALGRLVEAELRALTAHPWLPRIMVQEVLAKDTSLRELFVERFASRALRLVRPMLDAEARAGRLRDDLDPQLALLSLLGMCVFPFLAEPVLGRVVGYCIDEDFAARFIPHTLTLLERALEVRP